MNIEYVIESASVMLSKVVFVLALVTCLSSLTVAIWRFITRQYKLTDAISYVVKGLLLGATMAAITVIINFLMNYEVEYNTYTNTIILSYFIWLFLWLAIQLVIKIKNRKLKSEEEGNIRYENFLYTIQALEETEKNVTSKYEPLTIGGSGSGKAYQIILPEKLKDDEE